ncbi:hypothetical protein [Flavobacterium nitratireducens]|uniref:hypothetical protein n=1 Tax=Flavobacterium nitratireducens TaxID=992289 RepID=UPI00241591D6|nr:hypothetical protein [Flavobacterium nitratireducens]
MKKILFLFLLINLISCGNPEPNPCLISEDFIKTDLNYPDEAEFSSFDCSTETNSDGSYTVLRKISAKNAFGVQSSYVYKVKLSFNGGDALDSNNWNLISMQSEEYK